MSIHLHLRAVLLPDDVERDLWVHDGVLTVDRVPGADTVVRGGFAVPGLVDAHCHVGLTPSGPTSGADALAQAYTDRDTGALLLRDCGSPVDTRDLVDRQDTPRLIRAGRHLARTRRYVRGLGIEMEPDELPAAVAEQARYGGGWVKLVGDWIDRSVGDLTPLWPAGVLAEAVRRAHELGARVAVHTFGEEVIPDLVAAGVDSIEHGTGLTDDTIAAVAERGIALVPTLINTAANFLGIAAQADRYPTYAERMRRLHRTAPDRVRAAHEAGIPLYAGTDAGGTMPHGQVVAEIEALHAAGLPAEAALAAGSWAARDWLGLPGLVEGAPADLVIYDRDPRTDLSVLHTPTHIILRGRLVDPFVG